MITQEISPSELKRLKALDEYRILDTPNEAEYDDIAQLAAYISDAPVALISFIDINRQWFKSKVGVEMCETERNISFCTHAIEAEEDVLEIKNALEDDRFKNNRSNNHCKQRCKCIQHAGDRRRNLGDG